MPKVEVQVPEEILSLSGGRLVMRQNKDWEKADEIRKKIEKLGWNIKDVGDGFVLEKI